MGNTQYVVSIKLRPDDEVTSAVKSLLDGVKQGVSAASDAGKIAKEAKVQTIDYTTKFRESFAHMGRSVQGFRSELNFLRGTYQTLSNITGMGVRDVVSTALDWTVSLENVGLSVATVLSSVDAMSGGEFADFNDAQKKTADLFKLMRDEAKNTPAEFEDIAQSFQNLLPLTRSLVPNLEDIVKLASSTSTWDIMGGFAKGTTARDVRQILGGQVAITQIQNPLIKGRLNELKDLMSEARALEKDGGAGAGLENQKKALEIMQQLLVISPKAAEAWGSSFTGLSNNVKGLIKVLFAEGSAGVFGDLKGWLKELTLDIEKNPQFYRNAAKDFAEFVKVGAIALYDVFKFFYDNFGTVKDVFMAFVYVWTGVNVARFIGALTAFAAVVRSGTFMDFIRALAGFTKNPALAGAGGAAAAGAGGAAAGSAPYAGLLGLAFRLGGIGGLLANPATGDVRQNLTGIQMKNLAATDVLGYETALGMKPTGMSQIANSNEYMDANGNRGTAYSLVQDYIESLQSQMEKRFGIGQNTSVDIARGLGQQLQAMMVFAQPDSVVGAGMTDRKDQTQPEINIKLEVTGNVDASVVSAENANVTTDKKGVKSVGTPAGDW